MRMKLPSGTQYAPYLFEIINGNHTLIAGTTGSGKSVLENGIIKALLCSKYPFKNDSADSAQLILIDPKKVELRPYKNLPHTLMYADTIPDIISTLNTVRRLVDERLARMIRKGQRTSTETPIYVFIDEIVDLVESSQSKQIIRILSDIISISRCTQIFTVISTQAPNRRILKPEIVLNMNCRVGLRCNKTIESQQIIGDNDATMLPKHGEGIVIKDIDRYRINIPMYSDMDLLKVIKHWERQMPLLERIKRMIG